MSAAEEWRFIEGHPEVQKANRELDALEERELELTRQLGKALRMAQSEARDHLAAYSPWQEPCRACGRQPLPGGPA